MKLNAAGHRGDAEDLETEHPEVDVAAGIPGRVGQRGVAVPALIRRFVEEPGHVEDDRAGQEDPEAEGIQPREGDIAGADLERHDVVEERDAQRHDARKIMVVPCIVKSSL